MIQRHDAAWLRNVASAFEGLAGDLRVRVEKVERAGPTVSMTLEYSLGGEKWRQSFQTVPLDDADVEALLSAAGLKVLEYAGQRQSWIIAQHAAGA